jgi:hypothetical protein
MDVAAKFAKKAHKPFNPPAANGSNAAQMPPARSLPGTAPPWNTTPPGTSFPRTFKQCVKSLSQRLNSTTRNTE